MLVLGGFENGRLSQNFNSIVFNKRTAQIVLNSSTILSRPNGMSFIFGVHHLPDGTSLSGLFDNNKLVLPLRFNLVKLNVTDDFLDMGGKEDNSKFGPRYVKHSVMEAEDDFYEGDIYIGEWSTETHKPHGRGICIRNGEDC